MSKPRYNADGTERKFATDKSEVDVSQFHTITAEFEAERFPGSELLDTNVELKIPRFAITWNDRGKLMQELAAVIRKFQI